jgi:NAD(P)-dependent dehydrogenase (short-subunit alcohol dehydrogenase family)
MGRIVLISDAETPLGAELIDAYLQAGDIVVAAGSPQAAAKPERAADSFLAVDWNRRSSLSARNVLLTARNRLGAVDEAVILDCHDLPEKLLQELSSAEVESAVDAYVKGSVFLAREIMGHFTERGRGVLCFAAYSPQAADSPAPPLDGALREAFRGLARSLLATCSSGPLTVNAFQSYSSTPGDFARFIVRTLDEKARKISGRWFTLEPRQGFLQGFVPTGGKRG